MCLWTQTSSQEIFYVHSLVSPDSYTDEPITMKIDEEN